MVFGGVTMVVMAMFRFDQEGVRNCNVNNSHLRSGVSHLENRTCVVGTGLDLVSCLESVGELRVGGLKRKIRGPRWISASLHSQMLAYSLNFLVCG